MSRASRRPPALLYRPRPATSAPAKILARAFDRMAGAKAMRVAALLDTDNRPARRAKTDSRPSDWLRVEFATRDVSELNREVEEELGRPV